LWHGVWTSEVGVQNSVRVVGARFVTERHSHAHLPQDLRIALQPQQVPLLLENLPTHLQHHLEPLLPLQCILLKPVHGELFDAIPDLLPPAAERRNLRALHHERLVVRRRRRGLVDAGFAYVDEIRHGHVHAAEGDFLGGRVDVGGFVDEGGVRGAEERVDPFGGGLSAGYEAFGSELWVGVLV